jgi:hypothetical protein
LEFDQDRGKETFEQYLSLLEDLMEGIKRLEESRGSAGAGIPGAGAEAAGVPGDRLPDGAGVGR